VSQLRKSSRIILRRLTSADLADFQSYRNDQDVGLYQGWSQQSDADALNFLQEMGAAEFFRPGTWFQIGIADRDFMNSDDGYAHGLNERAPIKVFYDAMDNWSTILKALASD